MIFSGWLGGDKILGKLPGGSGVVFLTVILVGCTWNRSTGPDKQVRIITAEELAGCNNVGTTHVSVVDRLPQMSQTEGAVAAELVSLARTSALQLGGNAIVEMTNIEEGGQSFAIFKCRSGD